MIIIIIRQLQSVAQQRHATGGNSGPTKIELPEDTSSRTFLGRAGRIQWRDRWRSTRSHQLILSDNLYVKRLCQVGVSVTAIIRGPYRR